MKYKIVLYSILSVLLSTTVSAQNIPLDSVMNYVGKEVTICAKVQSIAVSKSAKKTTYINFGKPYPNQSFTVVIFEESLKNFSYTPAEHLKDKNVCITGTIMLYKEKSQIVVNKGEVVKIQ